MRFWLLGILCSFAHALPTLYDHCHPRPYSTDVFPHHQLIMGSILKDEFEIQVPVSPILKSAPIASHCQSLFHDNTYSLNLTLTDRKAMDKLHQAHSNGFFGSVGFWEGMNFRLAYLDLNSFTASARLEIIPHTLELSTDKSHLAQASYLEMITGMVWLKEQDLGLADEPLSILKRAYRQKDEYIKTRLIRSVFNQFGTHVFLMHIFGGMVEYATQVELGSNDHLFHYVEQQVFEYMQTRFDSSFWMSPLDKAQLETFLNNGTLSASQLNRIVSSLSFDAVMLGGDQDAENKQDWFESLRNPETWATIDRKKPIPIWEIVEKNHKQDLDANDAEIKEFAQFMDKVYVETYFPKLIARYPAQTLKNDYDLSNAVLEFDSQYFIE